MFATKTPFAPSPIQTTCHHTFYGLPINILDLMSKKPNFSPIISKPSISQFPPDPCQQTSPPHNSFHRWSILLQIYDALRRLNSSMAPGLDDIDTKLFQSYTFTLCGPLHHLINLSLKNSQVSSALFLHQVTPICNSGDWSLVSNYQTRYISLLRTVSKVLQSLVYDKVIDLFSCSLSTFRLGFLSSPSTLRQLYINPSIYM